MDANARSWLVASFAQDALWAPASLQVRTRSLERHWSRPAHKTPIDIRDWLASFFGDGSFFFSIDEDSWQFFYVQPIDFFSLLLDIVVGYVRVSEYFGLGLWFYRVLLGFTGFYLAPDWRPWWVDCWGRAPSSAPGSGRCATTRPIYPGNRMRIDRQRPIYHGSVFEVANQRGGEPVWSGGRGPRRVPGGRTGRRWACCPRRPTATRGRGRARRPRCPFCRPAAASSSSCTPAS